ncbi:MAG: hypothetical protein ABI851_03420 [Saprospiraceae bacterium]
MNTLRILVFLLIATLSCKKDKRNEIPDVSTLKKDISFTRFEREIFSLDTNNIESSVQKLFAKYPVFSRIYFQSIMQLTKNVDSLDSKFYEELKSFCGDPFLRMIQYRTDSLYADFNDLKPQFEQTEALAKYYFPKSNPVQVYTMISSFNVGNIIFSINDSLDGLGISLDFFLGNDFDYKQINPTYELFAKYITRSFNKEHILKKTWMPWTEDVLKEIPLNNLLDHMIFEGKKLYLLKKIMPNIQDSVLYEFTPEQVKWCENNKMDIWSFLNDKEYIQSTKRNEIMRYVSPSPTSPGMPKASPGRAAVYIGLDIVRSYMENHPEYKLDDLIKEESAQKILDEARYKPKNG